MSPFAGDCIYIARVLFSTVMPTSQLHHPLTNYLHTSLLSSQDSGYRPLPLRTSNLSCPDNCRSSHTYFLTEPVMSYATSWKEGDGDFLLVVAGLTRSRLIFQAGKSSKITSEKWSGSKVDGLIYTQVKVSVRARCKAGVDSKTRKTQMLLTVSAIAFHSSHENPELTIC